MRLTESSLDRIVGFIARNDKEGLARYLVPCLPAGSPLKPVRELMARNLSSEFQAFALEAVPWLAEDRIDSRRSAYDRVRDLLEAAGDHGVALSEFGKIPATARDQALEEMIRSGEVVRERRTTGGRPGDRYRLAEYAAGITPADHDNPFAFTPRPLDF